MKSFSLVLSLICIVGCEPPAKQQPDEAEGGASPQMRTPANLVTVETVESTIADDARPRTADELKNMFVEQYRADPQMALVNLFDWGDLSQAKRKEILGGLLTLTQSLDGSKKYPLIDEETRLLTVKQYISEIDMTVSEYNEGLAVPCTHVLEVTMAMSDSTTSSTTLDIGTRDGVYYFYSN